MDDSHSKLRHVEIDGVTYSYLLKNDLPGCNLTPYCDKKRALVELAPRRYAKLHSDEEITDEIVKEFILTNKK